MATSPPLSHQTRPLRAAILGTDALLAAMPSTPVQLAHACQRAGFNVALPASWGDELVAAHCLRELAVRGAEPVIMCSCAHVRTRLLAKGGDLASFCISTVAPPVCAARYLRAIYGTAAVHVTYIGDCPGAVNESIDAHYTPREFLSRILSLGINVASQPTVFESVIPPDRRRHFSEIGGLPAAERLRAGGSVRSVVEIDVEDYAMEMAQYVISKACVLIDVGPRLGCRCAGATPEMTTNAARAAVTALEPPRALSPVLDLDTPVEVAFPLPPRVEREVPVAIEVFGAADIVPAAAEPPVRVQPRMEERPSVAIEAGLGFSARRTPPSGIPRVSGSVPTARAAGRSLPRAYVSKRRSPTSVRVVNGAPSIGRRSDMFLAEPAVETPPEAMPAISIPVLEKEQPREQPPVVRVLAPEPKHVAPHRAPVAQPWKAWHIILLVGALALVALWLTMGQG